MKLKLRFVSLYQASMIKKKTATSSIILQRKQNCHWLNFVKDVKRLILFLKQIYSNTVFLYCRHCGVLDPSWSELYHFVSFLNRQLKDFETSTFCSQVVLNDLPGFRSFVLKFMIQMSMVRLVKILYMHFKCTRT